MSELYIGLLSGTSMDGVDAAIVDFSSEIPKIIATHAEPFPTTLKEELKKLCRPGDNEINRMSVADIQVAELFSTAVLQLLKKEKRSAEDIRAIGSHGQSIRHLPQGKHPFTLQIGDPNTIAARTNITTVADFRRKDIALGGQGAPLAPGFHQFIFKSLLEKQNVAVLNIGGIANLTLLSKTHTSGFDTGPGNTLLDAWIFQHKKSDYDKNGTWAQSGKTQTALLKKLLGDPYFQKIPPKSTGPEYFNLTWLNPALNEFPDLPPEDVQATLTELTAHSIANSLITSSINTLIICGGGIHNSNLIQKIKNLLPAVTVQSSDEYGINPDWMEAMLFAWLAKQRLTQLPGNIIEVTGARCKGVLGGIYSKL